MPKKIKRRTFFRFSILSTLSSNFGFSSQDNASIGLKGRGLFGLSKAINISKQGIDELEDYYDLVVVGSGYGGSVTASKLARANPEAKICIIERGKEYHPSQFPRSFRGLLKAIRAPHNHLGLIESNFGNNDDRDVDIISASGVGGSSLINAAISARPDALVFKQAEWPWQIQNHIDGKSLGGLTRFYNEAERLLGSQLDQRVASTKTSSLFTRYAKKLGVYRTNLLELTINFRSDRTKDLDAGLIRPECNLCGDCCSGCTRASKTILPYNYLHLACKAGCAIFSRSEVMSLTKLADSKYQLEVANTGAKLGSKTVTAKNVILAAGAQGSTELLLKAAKNGLSSSPQLGKQVSLNGDVLGFCYNGREKTNIAGVGQEVPANPKTGKYEVGPGISSYAKLDVGKKDEFTLNGQCRATVMTCTIPSPLVNIVAKGFASHALNYSKKMKFDEGQWRRVELDRKYIPGLGRHKAHPDGAINHSMLLLACGHDAASGFYEIDRLGKIKLVYKDVHQQPFYTTATKFMKQLAEEMGGQYFDNPRTTIFKGKMMATHPLGGCPMGDSHLSGAVNHKAQVFDAHGGVHQGLYVVDGSIIPRSLGVPPSLTIAALAERSAELMIADRII